MSYTIRIGQAVVKEYEGGFFADVAETKSPDAPFFAHDSTEGTNDRYPAYLAWEQFFRKSGLWNLFYSSPRNLMQEGQISRISNTDLRQIRAAIRNRKAENPEGIPGFCGCSTCDPISRNPHAHRKEMDTTMARLLWLEYWFDWALRNCDRPAFRC